jgi:hypothetical protein
MPPTIPPKPPFHTVSGREITVYLNVQADPNDAKKSDIPYHRLLTAVGSKWSAITNKMNLKLTFVPGPDTGPLDPTKPPPPLAVAVDAATPTDRILYHKETVAKPSDVRWFEAMVGNGASASTTSQCTKTSYVIYETGIGYFYLVGDAVPDFPHELGHILGLVDRYFDSVYWDKHRVILRTCAQIRAEDWFDSNGDIQNNPVPNTGKNPYYADRASLLMHRNAVTDDVDYVTNNNLMSSLDPTLTPYQLECIGIAPNGLNKPPAQEKEHWKTKWIAILGDMKYSGLSPFYVWEDTSKDDKGLKYYPGNQDPNPITGVGPKPESYPCWSQAQGRALEGGQIKRPILIAEVMGKEESPSLKKLPKAHYDLKRHSNAEPETNMCYAKHVVTSLQ